MWTLNCKPIIDKRAEIEVNVEDEPRGGGAGGAIYAATSPQFSDQLCVKTLSLIQSGQAPAEVLFFRQLHQLIAEQIKKQNIKGRLKLDLQSLQEFLPFDRGWGDSPGSKDAVFCLVRRWCDGVSLKSYFDNDESLLHTNDMWRLEVAKRLCRVLVSLNLANVVHLDCYADNVFIQNEKDFDKMTTTLIDLEGCGMTANGNINPRAPTAFSKPGWILPWWYPRTASGDLNDQLLKNASRWQLTMAVLAVLTRTKSAVFTWLPPTSWFELARISQEVHASGQPPSVDAQRLLNSLLFPAKTAETQAYEQEFLGDCFGSNNLAIFIKEIVLRGLMSPKVMGRPSLMRNDELCSVFQAELTAIRL